MVNHGIGVDALNQVSFVPADITANNIVAISATPGTENKTYHVVRDDYANMLDITGLITKATGRQFEIFSLPDFVPELIRRCRKEDLLFPLLDFLVGSVDNIIVDGVQALRQLQLSGGAECFGVGQAGSVARRNGQRHPEIHVPQGNHLGRAARVQAPWPVPVDRGSALGRPGGMHRAQHIVTAF